MFLFGLVWFGLVWYGLVWFALVWFALVCFALLCFAFIYCIADFVCCPNIDKIQIFSVDTWKQYSLHSLATKCDTIHFNVLHPFKAVTLR